MNSNSQTIAQRTGLALRYRRCIEQPVLIITIVSLLCVLAAMQLRDFRFDASSDSLIAEGDPDLEYFEEISTRFAQRPMLVLTYRPLHVDLFSQSAMHALQELTTALGGLAGVSAVQSLLDAPLLQSPAVPLSDLVDGFRTLRSPDVDVVVAREELLASPVFRELLVSTDGTIAALIVDLNETVETAATLHDIRAIRDAFSKDAEIHLGGVPLVASDMATFVREDMVRFGLAVMALIALALYGFFRRLRWVLIPLGTSAVTICLTLGAIAALGKPITAVSSNLVALLTITTVSFTVHLIAAYRESTDKLSGASPCSLAFEAMGDKFVPCLYTALTTMIAFGSLMLSDIAPIRSFGWIMCLGIAISLIVTYSFFASILVLLPSRHSNSASRGAPRLTRWFASAATLKTHRVILASLLLCIVAAIGAEKITLGNRIVEYFRGDTEIRQGLEVIDRELGGTIPLDVVLRFPPFEARNSKPGTTTPETLSRQSPDPFADPFLDPAAEALTPGGDTYPERFWFTPAKIRIVEELQRFMDRESAIGKTLSVSNFERVARDFNDGEPLSYVALTGVLGVLPADLRRSFVDPLASPASGELRIAARLHETGDQVELTALIERIRNFATQELGLAEDDVR
ncbi:MAG: MMPL family transporter, partial [Chromatocurvus sp.]